MGCPSTGILGCLSFYCKIDDGSISKNVTACFHSIPVEDILMLGSCFSSAKKTSSVGVTQESYYPFQVFISTMTILTVTCSYLNYAQPMVLFTTCFWDTSIIFSIRAIFNGESPFTYLCLLASFAVIHWVISICYFQPIEKLSSCYPCLILF